MIDAVAAFVAERPDDHRSPVLVALDHPRHSLDELCLPDWVRRRLSPYPVALDVGLAEDEHAVLVAQFEEPVVVRVVRSPHGVDVVALHQLDVASHRCFADDLAGVRIVVVTIDAPDLHRPPVDGQL